MRVVPPGGSGTATLVLDRPAPAAGLSVALWSDDVGVVTVPASADFLGGWIAATVTLTWAGVGATVVHASLGGVELELQVTSQADGSLSVLPLTVDARAIAFEIVPSGGLAALESDAPGRPVAEELVPETETVYDEDERPEVDASEIRPSITFASEV